MSIKILVVEDNFNMVRLIENILIAEGYTPVVAYTAEDGLQLAKSTQPALALLDVMVPKMGGWELCRHLRQLSGMPIIFLTALGDTDSVVRGLELGADDYVTKPFEQIELTARIKAHLRRRTMGQPKQRLSFSDGEFVLDLAKRTLEINQAEIDLTPREFDLLAALAKNESRVLTTRELLRQAWDIHDADYNIKPYIHYLRKKIEANPAKPRWIKTARGVGYRFDDDS
ncbi:MAG TPA: response regulator transcription factor [Anaerolineae bacterium]|nr:response regulator transcription factor [Anaerolineae bacterium]